MILVLADDITGAAEIAGLCLNYKLSVAMSVNQIPEKDVQVGIIITDSRSLTEKEAYENHFHLIEHIKWKYQSNDIFIFKKCDSVLRGFVITELLPFKEILHFRRFLLIPANPQGGRTIFKGKYYIDKKLIAKTSFKNDPDFPALKSSVKNLLLLRNPLSVSELKIRVNASLPFSDGVNIYDCQDIIQMQHIIVNSDFDMAAGSSAFFEQWLRITFPALVNQNAGTSTLPSDAPSSLLYNKKTKKLIIAGSVHQEIRNLERLVSEHHYHVISIPDKFLQPEINNEEFERWLHEASTESSSLNIRWIGLGNKKISFPNSSTILKQRLNKLAEVLLSTNNYTEIIIIGGASAFHFIQEAGWTDLEAIESIGPGILRMKVNGPNQLHLTIKPGSYPWTNFEQDLLN